MYYVGGGEQFRNIRKRKSVASVLEEVQVVCFTIMISFVPYWLENDGLIGQVYQRRK